MTRAAFVIPGDITLATGGYAYDRQVLARLAEAGIDARHIALPGSYPSPSGEELAATKAILSKLDDDVVLLIDGLAYGAMPGDIIAGLRQKIVALVHHPLCLEAGLAPMRARYLQQTEQMALTLAEHVITTSPTTARTLHADFAVPPSKTTVAIPGTERALRARGSGQPIELLAVGSIVPRKAYDILAMALLSLPPTPAWHLNIVGAVRDNAARSSLEAQLRAPLSDGSPLASRVDVLGAVDDACLHDLYDHADIFVMSSLYEGFGMVLTEAMARGLPLVCTTGGAAAETVPDAAAVKVRPGDPDAIALAIADVIGNATRRQSLADASWAAGQTLATWDDTARIVAAVLKRVSS